MAVRKYKPTTPGRRGASVSTFDELTRSEPEKSLVAKGRNKAGRNTHGRITARHQGGGTKRRYRVVDFRRNKDGVPAKVAHIEYDPNRSARIALLHYVDGEKRYILAPDGVAQGDGRRRWQRRARVELTGQGRSRPLAAEAPLRARRRHEPGRPSARRRRGEVLGWSSPHLAVGEEGRPHQEEEEGVDEVHRPAP